MRTAFVPCTYLWSAFNWTESLGHNATWEVILCGPCGGIMKTLCFPFCFCLNDNNGFEEIVLFMEKQHFRMLPNQAQKNDSVPAGLATLLSGSR